LNFALTPDSETASEALEMLVAHAATKHDLVAISK
jgi:hypothetical protein